MTKIYVMLKDSAIEAKAVAGTKIYKCVYYDYGLARDDTRMTGVEHWSMTLNEDGSYPSFTVPVTDFEEIKNG